MSNEIDEYFNRKSTEWNIFDFLAVRRSGGDRKSGLQLCKLKDNQTDRQEAKRWENAQRSVRSGSLFHFYNPKFEGNSLVGEGIINDFHQSEKRSREKDHGVVPPLYTPTRSPMFKVTNNLLTCSCLKPEIIVDENVLTFDETIQLGNSEWRLSSGELIKNVLSQKTSMVLENFKNAKLNAFTASVISRLGLSSIVDLSSEFPNGMHTWFGEEWYNLKRKVVFARSNEGSFSHDNLSSNHEDILHNVHEDGKENKLTEMEFVLKTVAPVMDIIFSDMQENRFEDQNSRELSHIECAQAPTPAKIVRDRSKILRTNKCILDNYLRLNIPDQDVENSAVLAFQFAGLHGQLLAVDLLDNGLYFGTYNAEGKCAVTIRQHTDKSI
ncbi:10318_t:CDS:10 [Entrophospora sp. SA101]|nr:10318_t:CDS:10 [Entrophospora sp. SA101]